MLNCTAQLEQPELLIQKGTIEILSDASLNKQWTPIDTAFEIAHQSILELEKNLLYKMTDKIHLKFIQSLSEYEKFQQQHSSGNSIPSDQSNDVFFPIYISCDYDDLVKQIRYAVANQFINEYLFGISLKDKFQLVQEEDVPKWLYLGFCNYFSCGIQQYEFQDFIYSNKLGKYKNINNLGEADYQLFGMVLWYLFEKEKGKDINSAFWYLIKYANSFEKTFEYQFGIKFKTWLKERIIEIEHYQSPRVPKAELEISPSKINGGILIESSLNDELSGLLLVDNQYNSEIYSIYNNSINKIISVPTLGLYPRVSFNKPIILFANNSGYVFCRLKNQWELHSFPINQKSKLLKNQFLPKSNFLINQDIKPIKLILIQSKLFLVYQFKDSMFKLDFNRSKKEFIMCLNQKTHIEDISYSKNHFIVFYKTSIRREENSIRGIVYDIDGGNSKEIYCDSIAKVTDCISSVVIEGDKRISFLKSKERSQSIDFLENSNSNWHLKSTNGKGLFYNQNYQIGNETITESFYYNKNWSFNRLIPNSDLLLDDTFRSAFFSFDTSFKVGKVQSIKKSTDSNAVFFISDYDPTPIVKHRQNISFQKLKTQLSVYSDWLYLKDLKFEFTNREMSLPYSIKVPFTETYNSIVTPTFSGNIYSANQKQKFHFLGFSNINRRRIGFELSHSLSFHTMELQQSLQYRLRQYEIDNNRINRNRSFQYKIGLLKKFGPIRMSIEGNFLTNSDIALLTSFQMADWPMYTKFVGGAILNMEINPFNHLKNPNLRMLIYGQILPQTIFDNREYKASNFSYGKLGITMSIQKGFVEINSKLDALYSLGSQHMLCYIGGSNGLFSNSNFYSETIKKSYNSIEYPLQSLTGYVRGFPMGSRAGSNSLVIQTDFDFSIFHLFRSRVIEKSFPRNFKLFTFLDAGTAFSGKSTSDIANSYNTYTYQTPNYILTVNSIRNPWIISSGFGVKIKIWDYHFRMERAYGIKENKWQSPITSFSLGKNF